MSETVEEQDSTTPDGEVTITLGGQDKLLKPTFGAARTISAKYGGLQGAVNRIAQLDMEAIIDVVTLGLGYSQRRRPPSDLGEQIWKEGLTDTTGSLAEKCITYLHILMGGGRLPDPNASELDDEEERDIVDPQ